VGEDDAMLELYGDVFASSLLDDQPIFEPARIRALFGALPDRTPEERLGMDSLLNRILSLTLMHQRFGMSG
jgi:asparagine synthase (glutamine-hydrolysing)